MTRLVGVASVLVDVALRLPHLPPRGGDVVAADAGRAAGGGLNALAAAARLGLPAVYAGPHGTGPHGDAVRAALAAAGVAVALPPRPDGDTGWCLAFLEPDGERTFVTVPGVEADQRRGDLDALARDGLRAADLLYVSGYDLAYPGSGPVLGGWLADLPPHAAGGPTVVLDPGPLAGDVPAGRLAAVLARTDLLTLSAAEAGTLGLSAGLDALAGRPLAAATVVLRGGAGTTRLRHRGTVHEAPAAPPPGPVADTNGAGDVHTGALLAGLAAGHDAGSALGLAQRAAAWSVTRPGADSGPGWADLGLDGPLRPITR